MDNQPTKIIKDQLTTDFERVIADTESLLKATANQGGEMMAEVRSKAEASLALVKERMAETQAALMEKTKAACKATDTYVHDNPWQSVGVGAFVGLIVGLLIGRR
jgi:ElaB/YqjD/DUF883 family membrane-anchored ribosome-binding protein